MGSERVIYTFPNEGPAVVRLVAVDVTDPTIHAQHPYQLARFGYLGGRIVLQNLRRTDLEHLHDCIGWELGR